MKYLALAVILFVMQAAPPMPRRTPNPGTGASQAVQNHPKSNEKIAEPPPPTVQTISAQPDQHSNAANSHNKEEKTVEIGKLPSISVSRDAIDYLGLGLTFTLLIVGIFGVRAAYRTLMAIEQQVGEMKAQRETMQRQLRAMRGQLVQMESSGKQTDTMIEQITQQVGHLKTSADAAKNSADAANRNIDLIVNKERARLRVEMIDTLSLQVGEILTAEFKILFHGFTDAFSVETAVDAGISKSRELPMENGFRIPDRIHGLPSVVSANMIKPRYLAKIMDKLDDATLRDIQTQRRYVHCWGIIRYKDFFDVPRQTTFQYRWRAIDPSSPLSGITIQRWEKTGSPEANQQT